MITEDAQLKLQAYLDGELAAAETGEVKSWLDRDPAAQALLGELSNTKAALAGHEAGCRVPESREFFWSKIEREIERQSQASEPEHHVSFAHWLRRHFLPLSGVAMLSCMLGLLFIESGKPVAQFGEMEMASDDMGSYTFRDQDDKITAVWFYNHGDDSQGAGPVSEVRSQPE